MYTRQVYKQQQSNLVVTGEEEPRYFEGVQGIKELKGELWGVGNLLKLTANSLMTRDILQKGQQVSGRQYKIKELKLGDPWFSDEQAGPDDLGSWSMDDLWENGKLEDRGLGHLAQMLLDDVSEKREPAIVAHDGKAESLSRCAAVVYCHQHDTVFGMQDGYQQSLNDNSAVDKYDSTVASLLTVEHSHCDNNQSQDSEVPSGTDMTELDEGFGLLQHRGFCLPSHRAVSSAGRNVLHSKPRIWEGAVFHKAATHVWVRDPEPIRQNELNLQHNSSHLSAHTEMNAVESLAAWCGISCIEMANALLKMQKSDRQKLLSQYGEDDANPR